MRFLSATVAAAISATAFTQIAFAADLPRKAPAYTPPPPVFSWTGFYVGLNAGWGWSHGGDPTTCFNSATGNSAGCAIVPDSGLNADGFIGGGQLGYNYQVGTWVFGIEADFQGADIKDTLTVANLAGAPVAFNYTASQKMNWFGTVRPRVGYAWDRALLYVTGGLAYGHRSASNSLNFVTGIVYAGSNSDTRAGWTVGGGLEYAFTNNWTAKIEGLYYDLGDLTVVANRMPTPDIWSDTKVFDFRGGIIRVGVNYKF